MPIALLPSAENAGIVATGIIVRDNLVYENQKAGIVDPGEQCDDGNSVNGDGCDDNCTFTACGNGIVSPGEDCDDGNTQNGDSCPAGCHFGEPSCGNCVDDDGNGLVDALDPACQPGTLTLGAAALTPSRGLLRLTGTLPIPAAPGGAVAFVLADGNGTVLCGDLGTLAAAGSGRYAAHGKIGAGRVSLRAREDGSFALTARKLDLSKLDDPNVRVGLSLGDAHFAGAGPFRARGGRRIYP